MQLSHIAGMLNFALPDGYTSLGDMMTHWWDKLNLAHIWFGLGYSHVGQRYGLEKDSSGVSYQSPSRAAGRSKTRASSRALLGVAHFVPRGGQTPLAHRKAVQTLDQEVEAACYTYTDYFQERTQYRIRQFYQDILALDENLLPVCLSTDEFLRALYDVNIGADQLCPRAQQIHNKLVNLQEHHPLPRLNDGTIKINIPEGKAWTVEQILTEEERLRANRSQSYSEYVGGLIAEGAHTSSLPPQADLSNGDAALYQLMRDMGHFMLKLSGQDEISNADLDAFKLRYAALKARGFPVDKPERFLEAICYHMQTVAPTVALCLDALDNDFGLAA